MRSQKSPFIDAIVKTLSFFERQKVEYFLLGGVAVTLLGEPRFTKDLDIDLFLPKESANSFFDKLKKADFTLDKREATKRVKETGTFRFSCRGVGIDIILASTELENSALKRKKRISLYGVKTWLPSPEDLILLKLIPGRPKDLIDVESVILRHRKKLDVKYLETWAQKISDEMQNFRVWHQLKKILKG